MYRTNSVHAPMFKEKGEVQSSVLTGSGGSELQLAYAVTDNFAVMANGVFDKSKARVIDTLYNVKSGNSNYQNLYLEGGIGYYKTFGKDTSKMFGVFIGGGAGKTEGFSDLWTEDFLRYNSNYNRIFWQPVYGIIRKNVELSGTVRFNFLNYTKLSISDGGSFGSRVYDVYAEPAVTLKAGMPQFKIVAQVGSAIPLKKKSYYTASPIIFSVGFHLNFTRYWEKQDNFFED